MKFFLFYCKHCLSFFTKLHFLILTKILFILYLKVIILNLRSIFQLYFVYILIILLIIVILLHCLDQTFILYAVVVLSNSPHKHYISTHGLFRAIHVIFPIIVVVLRVFLIYFSLPIDLALTKQFQNFLAFSLGSSTL